MNIIPLCYECQVKRLLSELRMLNFPAEKELQITKEMLSFYGNNTEKRSAWVGYKARKKLFELTGIKDPYVEKKKLANDFALDKIGEFNKYLQSISDPFLQFKKACLGTIMGNLMEFFLLQHEFTLSFPKPIVEMVEEEKFAIDNLKETYDILKSANKILLLTDNAGEIVFDKSLLQIIHQQFPQLEKITVAVKSGPIINDACMDDANQINMKFAPKVEVITTGIDSIGLFFEKTSKEFKKIWYSSDLIIKKGMGHQETSDYLTLDPPCPILYLLRIKCDAVANMVGVKYKDNVARLFVPKS